MKTMDPSQIKDECIEYRFTADISIYTAPSPHLLNTLNITNASATY